MARIADLREYVDHLDEHDQLETIDGADWDLEIGGLTELGIREGLDSALLFDHIPGYEAGYRVLTNSVITAFQWTSARGYEPTTDLRDAIIQHKAHSIGDMELHEPDPVAKGPVLDNVVRGAAVDVTEFPAPFWHEKDGGRYIGTADVVITDNPDTGAVNAGTYRVQIQDSNKVTHHISPGKDGRVNLDAYLDRGEPCPMVMCVGQPVDLFIAGTERMPSGVQELEYAGGIRGEPVEVIEGEATGLPIPANAELVLEGHVYPDDEPFHEGPFGEWTGYYSGGSIDSEEHMVTPLTVERIYHRDDPIILGSAPLRPPAKVRSQIRSAARLWNELDEAGIPGISEVNSMPFGPGWFEVVSISQQYGGHSAQVGQHAASGPADAYQGRFTVVVDDDIDVFDQDAVMWAICSRCDPADDIHILENCWSSPLDPVIHPDRKRAGDFTNSRAIIDATRPYHWREEFPEVNEASAELRDELREKWTDLFEQDASPPDETRVASMD